LEDMDLEEISVVTGMPANTVKTHLHRAVTAIRTKLGGKNACRFSHSRWILA
jgi:RNA polymerase sigma-70 factor (ECF subfamily)